MNDTDIDAPPPTPSRRPIVNRSKGTKLIIVCVLAVLMAIPALLVWGLLLERTHRAETVAKEIGGLVGGPQTFMGPVINLPYVDEVPVALAIKLDGVPERLPERPTVVRLAGIDVPCTALDAMDGSAPIKVELLLQLVTMKVPDV